MMGIRRVFIIAAVLLAACNASAESLRGAEMKISKAWAEQNAIQARIRISAIVQAGPNLLQVKGEGTLEFLRDGELEKWRQSLTIAIPEPVGSESRHDAIFDGKSLYLANEMMGQREARMAPTDIGRGIAPPGGEPLLKVLKEALELSLLREDNIDDRLVYVIEGTPKGTSVEFTKGVFYIDQATGLQLRQEIYTDENLAARVIVLCEEVKTGVEIDPRRFVVEGDAPPQDKE